MGEFIAVVVTVHLHSDDVGCVDDIDELRILLNSTEAHGAFLDVAVLVKRERWMSGIVDSDVSVSDTVVLRLDSHRQPHTRAGPA